MQLETKPTTETMTPDEPALPSDDPVSLDRSEVFHALQNSRRRGVVRYFTEFEGPVSIGDLADQVTAWEYETTVEAITKDQRQRVYIALYQSHLSKLDDSDVIEYDESSGTVAAGPNHELLARHASPASSASPDEATTGAPGGSATSAGTRSTDSLWTGSYLGVSLAGLVLVASHLFNVMPGQLVPLHVLNFVLIAAYLGVASGHWYTSR